MTTRLTIDEARALGLPLPAAVRSPRRTRCDGTKTVIEFVVPGTPIGKPRQTRRDKWQKRPCVMRYRDWADRCRAVAGVMPDAEKVKSVTVRAYFSPPKSWQKSHRLELIGKPHHCRPDADNLAKSVLDALWKNDSGIADLYVTKHWALSERTVIEITIEP